jgi:lipopolysaccharide exporter
MNIRKEIKSATFRQSILTSTSTIINGLLGISFYIFIARILGPTSFGIFSVGIVTLTLLADIANVGTDTGIVRFIGKYIKEDKEKALRFLKLGFEIKLVVGILLGVLGWIILPLVVTVLGKPELLLPLRLSVVGCLGAMLFSFATSALQAMQKFFIWGFVNIAGNSIRLIAIFIISLFGALTILSGLTLYIVVPFIMFVVSLLFLPKFFGVTNEKRVMGEFFKYNKWVAVFTLVAAISSRLDTFLATRILTLHDVGIYAVATNLAGVVPQIVFAIATVAAPKLASFTTKEQVKNYIVKLQLFVIILAILGVIVGSALSIVFIPVFYGSQYMTAVLPFILLLVAQAIFLISVPVHTSIFYYFGNPKIFFIISLGQLSLLAGLGWIFINQFGILGAAMALIVSNMFNFITPYLWVRKNLR